MDQAEAVLEESLTCCFCLELLHVPKTLSCGHNFCGKCLQQYLNNQNKTEHHLRGIKCPQCREETPVPNPLQPINDWVKQLRTNCAIQNVIEGITKKVRKDCDICQYKEDKVNSDYLCRTCNLSLCRSCYDVHKRIPVCSNHDVQQTSKAPPPKYKGFEFKVHLDISSTSKQRRRLHEKVIVEVKKKIESICQKAHKSLKEKEVHLMDQAKAVVDEIFQRFNASYPPAATEEWTSDSTADDSSLDDDSKDTHNLFTSIKLLSQVESFINSRYDIAVAKIHTDKEFKDEEITDVKQVANMMDPLLDESKDLEIEEISLAIDDEEESSSETSDELGVSLEDHYAPVLADTFHTMTDEDDSDPWIRNILVMTSSDTETIIVTDFNNSCVKAFYKEDEDITGPMPYDASRLVVKGRPWGITELRNERIAVTCPEKKLICIIRVDPSLKKMSDIRVPKQFYGIATINSTTLVASAPKERPPGIYILDHDGRILKAIVKDRQQKNLFELPYYIQMSSWGDIIVAEENARKILFVTKEGFIRSRNSPRECITERLSSLYGITSSKTGSVFLADMDSNKIILVREGRDDKVFLSEKDVLFFPRCVCLYNQESMFVGEEGGAFKKFQLIAQ